jgi:enamine deaminase RidA (YjgF/YER057c/UK114 family)
MRKTVSSGYAFEEEYGYARAVRVGNLVFVSGTTARGKALEGNITVQARDIISTIEDALKQAGASLDDVVRTVSYIRNMADVSELASAHRDAFGRARPASTVVEIAKLSPDTARLEIEVTACIDG